MTKIQIEYFIAVAEALSFTQAANSLYVSQPAISKSVSKLEKELGFACFERRENTLVLTEGGRKIYELFRKMQTEYKAAVEEIRQHLDRPLKKVRVGCPETWSPSFFYDKINSHFKNTAPEIEFSIECHKLSELILRLQSGKLDVVLTHDFFIPSVPGLAADDLVPTGCGIICSRAKYAQISSVGDFRNEPFLLFDNDIEKRFGDVIRSVCAEYGFIPKTVNCGQLSTALFETACGKGVMLFSDWDSAAYNGDFNYFPVKRPLQIKLMYMKDSNAGTVGRFIRETKAIFKDRS